MKRNYFLFIFIFIISVLYSQQKYWVIPKLGLNLREKPDAKTNIISIIPYNSQVEFISKSDEKITIDGIENSWFKVKWNEETGYLFGGYLTDKPSENINDLYNFELILNKDKYNEIIKNIMAFINKKNIELIAYDQQINDNKTGYSAVIYVVKFTDKSYINETFYEGMTFETNLKEGKEKFLKSDINTKNYAFLGKNFIEIYDYLDPFSGSFSRNYVIYIGNIYIKGFIIFDWDENNEFGNGEIIKKKDYSYGKVIYKTKGIKYISSFEDFLNNILIDIKKKLK